jgi:hypothetical protein
MIEVKKVTTLGNVFYIMKGLGIHHREDGPAIEWADGSKCWYLNGFYFSTKEEWFEALTEEQKEKALYSEYFIKD